MSRTVTYAEVLHNTLRESFRLDEVDGYWYPDQPGTPLVRVYVGGDAYMVERRRSDRGAWMPIVTANAAEFDRDSWRRWASAYPMVQTD